MWLSMGETIPKKYNKPTSDSRYGAIVLYFLRNKQRGDLVAILDVIDRLPHDLRIDENYSVYKI